MNIRWTIITVSMTLIHCGYTRTADGGEVKARNAVQAFIEARKQGKVAKVGDYFTKGYIEQFKKRNSYSLQEHFDTDTSYYFLNKILEIA